MLWQQIFSILAPMIFLLKIRLKSASNFKIVVFPLWRRKLVGELQIAAVMCCHSIVFGNSVSADRSGMGASQFLAAEAAWVILLRLAAESRKSH